MSEGTFLPPVEHPGSLLMKLGYYFSRKQFGKVFTPMTVFSARMPSAFSFFYGKVSRLDKKLRIPRRTASLIRGRVASLNGCFFCMDANRYSAIREGTGDGARLDALDKYRTSPLFDEKERAALEYVTELTRDRKVSPETFERMSAQYTEREICDIVWLVASEHLYNLNNIGLNIGSDGLCDIARSRPA